MRDPEHPRLAASFGDMAGYMHPHSYLRLPNGHVLATFQHGHHPGSAGTDPHASHASHGGHADREGPVGASGGLVEIDDHGRVVRAVSNADPAFTDALLMPYSLVVIPAIDRVVSTNSSMHDDDIFSGVTYQVWRLSDLKLLKTAYFDVGANHYAHISPEEPRLGPDGSVFVQTLGCGIERITGLNSPEPASKLVYTFPGNWCGVPTIVGHYLIDSVPAIHGFIALDIAAPASPKEVSRLTISDAFEPHWTAWDPKTRRLVVTPEGKTDDRAYLLKLDEATGALAIDSGFHDSDGKPGFDFADRDWPHRWKGTAQPHGAVFTR